MVGQAFYRMKKKSIRRIAFILGLLILFLVAFLLMSGSEWLVIPLWQEPAIPWGTPLTWLFLVALPATMLLGIPEFHPPGDKFSRRYRRAFLVLAGLAALWGFVSYALAGNWNYQFRGAQPGFRGSDAASPWFWVFSYALVISPFCLLLLYFGHNFLRKREQK